MKKVLPLLLMLLLVYLPLPQTVAEASGKLGKEHAKHSFDSKENSYEAWASIKIDSKPDPDVTGQELYEAMKHMGGGGMMSRPETYDAIITNSKKNGINPYVMLLMSIHESGWMKSKLAETHTNPFGMKCSSREISTCLNGYSKFKNVDDAFYDQSWLLRKHYVEAGLVTFKDVLLKYSPPSDGNDLFSKGGYIQSMRSNGYQHLGLTAEGNFNLGEMSPDANFSSSTPRTSSTEDGSDLFLAFEDPYKKRGIANDGSTGKVTEAPYLRYMMNSISDKAYNAMVVASYVGIAFILTYISFMLLVYVLYIKGNVGYEKAEKLIGKGVADTFGGTKGIIMVSGRVLLGLLIILIFVSGVYIHIIAFIYTMFHKLSTFIF